MGGADTTDLDVLVVRFGALGDVVLTLPIVDGLAQAGVRSIAVLTDAGYADVVRLSESPVDVVSDDERRLLIDRHFGAVLDLHTRALPLDAAREQLLSALSADAFVRFGSDPAGDARCTVVDPRRRNEHAVDCYARAVRALVPGFEPGRGAVRVPSRVESTGRRMLPQHAVCLAPGARYDWKRWPAASYSALADALAELGLSTVVVGHPFDDDIVAETAALSRSQPPTLLCGDVELVAVMAAAGRVVANASGLAMLAAASTASVTCIFSHVLPEMWRPWGPGHSLVTGEPARECDCFAGLDPDDLALRAASVDDTGVPCGRSIPVEVVVEAVIAGGAG